MRLLVRITASGAALAAAGALAVGALAPPAAADTAPALHIGDEWLPVATDLVVGTAGSPQGAYVIPSGNGVATNVTVTFDASEVGGSLVIGSSDPNCTTAANVVTCHLAEARPDTGDRDPDVAVTFWLGPDAADGDAIPLKVSASADNYPSVQRNGYVPVAADPERLPAYYRTSGLSEPEAMPRDKLAIPLRLAQAGEDQRTENGVIVDVQGQFLYTGVMDEYKNCAVEPSSSIAYTRLRCIVVDQAIEPGRTYRSAADTPLRIKVAARPPGLTPLCECTVVTRGASRAELLRMLDAIPADSPGTRTFRLEADPDTSPVMGDGQILISLPYANPWDADIHDRTVYGRTGDVVPMKVKLSNYGPADIRTAGDEAFVYVLGMLPTGVEYVSDVDDGLACGRPNDSTPSGDRVGLPRVDFVCRTMSVTAGSAVTAVVNVRITGTQSAGDGRMAYYKSDRLDIDADRSNDDGTIRLSVTV